MTRLARRSASSTDNSVDPGSTRARPAAGARTAASTRALRARVRRETLGTALTAELLGVSHEWVRKHRDELGGHCAHGRTLCYSPIAVREAALELGRVSAARALQAAATNDRVRRTAHGAVAMIPLALALLAIGAALAFIVSGMTNQPRTPAPLDAPVGISHALVTWTYVGMTCADGWGSPSIGKQGACSHHGGVVSVFLGGDGTKLVCGDGRTPPRTKAEQERLFRDAGSLLCIDGPGR
jgi:hypothetical protein